MSTSKKGLLAIVLLLCAACGKKADRVVHDSLYRLDNVELSPEAVEIVEFQQSGDNALAEIRVTTALKLRKTRQGWRVDEIRIGQDRWEKADHLLELLNQRKREQTRSDLEQVASAVGGYRQSHGSLPPVEDFEALIDTLAPRYLERVIRVDSWSNPFRLEILRTGAFLLRSAGPDGIMGSADDIVEEGR